MRAAQALWQAHALLDEVLDLLLSQRSVPVPLYRIDNLHAAINPLQDLLSRLRLTAKDIPISHE